MSMAINYENVHDAQMRLQNTVVLYDGEPVWIDGVREADADALKGDIFRVMCQTLPYGKGEPMRKYISSRKFDMAPFQMGFMNYNGRAYYCHRLPRRQQRQGLSNNTFSAEDLLGEVDRIRLEHAISYPEFLECIKGRYPSFADALKELDKDDVASVAFSRCFAVARDSDMEELIFLNHEKERVGFIMEGKLKLSKRGKCLRESLGEVGVEC